jgi:hypothetical protein
MPCKHCNSCGCEEDCVDFCLNCDNEIPVNEDFCSDRCQREYESGNET